MTTKDFKTIAEIIAKQYKGSPEIFNVAQMWAASLAERFPKFNETKFLSYVDRIAEVSNPCGEKIKIGLDISQCPLCSCLTKAHHGSRGCEGGGGTCTCPLEESQAAHARVIDNVLSTARCPSCASSLIIAREFHQTPYKNFHAVIYWICNNCGQIFLREAETWQNQIVK